MSDALASETPVIEATANQAAPTDADAPSIRGGGLATFYDWCARLPWHGWWLYPALALGLLIWGSAILWVTGRLPLGTLDPTLTVSVAYGPYTLGVLAYLNGVARRSLATFWPATGWPERFRGEWTHAFTTVRGGLGLPSLVLGAAIAIAATASAPPAIVGADDAGRLAYALALAPSAVLGYAMAFLAVAHTGRQLRLVVTIHARAQAIDPFDRAPVYAFSRFTAQIGLAFLISAYYTVALNGAFQSGNVVGLAVLGLIIALGVACFVVPLWGIHGRLVGEKLALLAGVEERVRKLAEELYRRIDAGEYDGTKVINEAIAAAGAVRERIAQLPTWPWPAQVFRGFVTALLLPIVVYVLTRIIGGRIGT